MSATEASSSRKRPRSDAATSTGRPAYPRKRAAQACGTCRKRRVKCDNERPYYSECVKLGVHCTYQEGDKSSFDTASLAILERLTHLEGLFRAAHPDTHDLEEQPSPVVSSSSRENGPPDFFRINVEAVLEWPILQPVTQDQPLSLANIFQAARTASDSSAPRLLATSDLDPGSTGPLLQCFMDNFHIYNPVLEIARIQQDIKTTLFNGLGWDAASCILLLVFALGTITDHVAYPLSTATSTTTSMAFRNSRRFQDAESFFLAAQRRMGQLLYDSNLAQAQAFFLAGVYLMSTMRPFEAWRMFVQALACCQIFVSPSSDNPDNKESQLHKIIYWASFKSELELRLELSITEHSAWSLHYPQFFPAPPTGLGSEGEAGWYFYLAEVALRRLGNRILTHTSHFQSAGTTVAEKVSRVMEFEQQAQSWVGSLPQNLRLDHPLGHDEDVQGERLRFILNGHLLDCYEMMYWSFIVDAVRGTLPEDAVSVSFARKGFQVSVQRIEDNETGFHHRHHGTWLMLRSCTRSALVLVAAARAGLDDLLPAEWKSSVAKVKDLLEYWKDEATDTKFRLQILDACT